MFYSAELECDSGGMQGQHHQDIRLSEWIDQTAHYLPVQWEPGTRNMVIMQTVI